MIFNKPDDLDPLIEISLDTTDNRSFNIWHVFVEGVQPGMGYAYRVDGPHQPWNGHRFDPEKVLVDPYSKGNCFKRWDRGSACVPGDNLHKSLRSVVIDVDTYDWEGDQPLKKPMAETIVYEMHVGGFTKSPTSGVQHPGTYLGLIEKIPYLKSLGNHPVGEKLIVDSLRFWVKEMHVDGFRFDEGSVLSRGEDGIPLEHPPVIWSIELDDLLGQSKVIAEAWDAAGLYQIGTFPGARWAEWNGKYRDCIRGFVKGDPGLIGELAGRLTGSADLYQYRHHEPTNSVNFVCAHDGFTLYDLTSYNEKHNWANGEGSNDGIDDNLSWNCGVEGVTSDPWINQLRERQVKNFAVIHMLSIGVPMIVAGDEFMRSQAGNNNTYCHDNEINWFDWNNIASSDSQEMIRFWSLLIDKRKIYIDHFKGKYFSGDSNKYGLSDVSWHGTKLFNPGWNDPQARCLAMTLGDTADDSDQTLNVHIMFNMYWEALEFDIPQVDGLRWYRSIDTSLASPSDISPFEDQIPINDHTYTLTARSVVVLISRAIT